MTWPFSKSKLQIAHEADMQFIKDAQVLIAAELHNLRADRGLDRDFSLREHSALMERIVKVLDKVETGGGDSKIDALRADIEQLNISVQTLTQAFAKADEDRRATTELNIGML